MYLWQKCLGKKGTKSPSLMGETDGLAQHSFLCLPSRIQALHGQALTTCIIQERLHNLVSAFLREGCAQAWHSGPSGGGARGLLVRPLGQGGELLRVELSSTSGS